MSPSNTTLWLSAAAAVTATAAAVLVYREVRVRVRSLDGGRERAPSGGCQGFAPPAVLAATTVRRVGCVDMARGVCASAAVRAVLKRAPPSHVVSLLSDDAHGDTRSSDTGRTSDADRRGEARARAPTDTVGGLNAMLLSGWVGAASGGG